MIKRLYVVAGELSGDAHAACLISALRAKEGELEVRGVGGANLRRVVGDGIRDWVDRAAVMGVWEVLKNYGWFRQQFFRMLQEVREFRPDCLLLVDYPGFNMRFAKAVRKALPETKIIQYVCPQVWAWNRKRIPMMERTLDAVLCLFPFEQSLFSNKNMKSIFVGHPLVDELEESRVSGIIDNQHLVGLFPGSREREVERLLPMMLGVARRLDGEIPGLEFELPAATKRLAEKIRGMIGSEGLGDLVRVTEGGSHELMQRAGVAVIASGTATLEAAYYGLPYCLVYRVAPLTYWMAKLLVKIRWIGIVNILAQKEVVRELIQAEANETAVAAELGRLLTSSSTRAELKHELSEAVSLLGGPGAHERAAEAVLGVMVGR